VKQTWHGHSVFRIEAGEAEILIDPFLSEPALGQGEERLSCGQELDTGR